MSGNNVDAVLENDDDFFDTQVVIRQLDVIGKAWRDKNTPKKS